MSDPGDDFPGQSLGLPREGRGSIAHLPRRILGLAIDWAATLLITQSFFAGEQLMPLIVFALIHIVFVPTIGGSPGHRISGLRLLRMDGAWTGVWRPIVRSALLVLVIPAVIWNKDNRGLHDIVAGTVLTRA